MLLRSKWVNADKYESTEREPCNKLWLRSKWVNAVNEDNTSREPVNRLRSIVNEDKAVRLANDGGNGPSMDRS